ncbi:small integral membrane protein 15 [Nematostella vectensis]|uniref:small integral membrane protein 15 n=1 Tax=Nematostella vectensis TaxID=45351 RepID=UPI0013902943|nr:small integral membrane protein 15 [Nematostella vectensis]
MAANTTWNDRLDDFLKYAATNPSEFLFYVFLVLTPLMAICGYLSLKLAHQIDQKEKQKSKKGKRQSNVAKTKRRAKAD